MALPNDGVPPDCRDDLNPPPAPPSCIDNLCLLLRRVVVEVPFRIDICVVDDDDDDDDLKGEAADLVETKESNSDSGNLRP